MDVLREDLRVQEFGEILVIESQLRNSHYDDCLEILNSYVPLNDEYIA